MEEHLPTQKLFWKRQGLKLPGSVSVVPSSTTTNETQKVIGARYNYTSLVITRDKNGNHSNKSLDKPSVSSPHTPPLSKTEKATATSRPQISTKTSGHRHHKSTKSFDAFLKDTNDEWSDELGYDTKQQHIRQQQQDNKQQPSPPPQKSPSHISAIPSPKTDTRPAPDIKTTQSKSANGIKLDAKQLMEDPTHVVYNTDPDDTADPTRTQKFKEVLSEANVDLAALRKLSWSGIPKEFRPVAWQLLLGYLPCNSARRKATLARKRKEYTDSVAASYARGTAGLDQTLWHQIHIDIPRTNPGVPLYQYEATQLCLERILYQWAVRHPASGYVQGINDLVTPLFEVFLSAYIEDNPEDYDVSQLDQDVLSVIEADSFWCLSKLLDGIQDNYTFAQPGIQRQVATLKELVSRIDGRLALHLQQEGIEFIQFAFRWMNCLLMRELPLRSTVRMWDTYLAEGSSEGFSEFHVYVCAAFLVKWSEQLKSQDFQGIMIFLQQLPTKDWQEKDVELLLSEAYMWKTLFHNAPHHLK